MVFNENHIKNSMLSDSVCVCDCIVILKNNSNIQNIHNNHTITSIHHYIDIIKYLIYSPSRVAYFGNLCDCVLESRRVLKTPSHYHHMTITFRRSISIATVIFGNKCHISNMPGAFK